VENPPSTILKGLRPLILFSKNGSDGWSLPSSAPLGILPSRAERVKENNETSTSAAKPPYPYDHPSPPFFSASLLSWQRHHILPVHPRGLCLRAKGSVDSPERTTASAFRCSRMRVDRSPKSVGVNHLGHGAYALPLVSAPVPKIHDTLNQSNSSPSESIKWFGSWVVSRMKLEGMPTPDTDTRHFVRPRT
jgi:hypothetical protein